MDKSPEQLLIEATDEFEKAMNDFLKKEAIYKDIDSQTKRIRATAFLEARGGVKTCEMLAEVNPTVITHLEALKQAREPYLLAKGRKDIAEKRFEAGRTLVSLEKSKISMM